MPRRPRLLALLLYLLAAAAALAETAVTNPFAGITVIRRTETTPRNVSINVVLVDLRRPGIRFKLTPHGGTRESVRQTTLAFLEQEHAQIAVNAHFFLPFPSQDPDAFLIGLAASEGDVYSAFETPDQSYALVPNAPALNIDRENRPAIVTANSPPVNLWNTVSGSAQIVTAGVATIPLYRDEANPNGILTPGGPNNYSNTDSWYERINARTAIGITRDARTLVLFTVDRAAGSLGLRISEVAEILIRDYNVWDALNLDGGGSTTLAIEDPETHRPALLNSPADRTGRAVASNLAVFAIPTPN